MHAADLVRIQVSSAPTSSALPPGWRYESASLYLLFFPWSGGWGAAQGPAWLCALAGHTCGIASRDLGGCLDAVLDRACASGLPDLAFVLSNGSALPPGWRDALGYASHLQISGLGFRVMGWMGCTPAWTPECPFYLPIGGGSEEEFMHGAGDEDSSPCGPSNHSHRFKMLCHQSAVL